MPKTTQQAGKAALFSSHMCPWDSPLRSPLGITDLHLINLGPAGLRDTAVKKHLHIVLIS